MPHTTMSKALPDFTITTTFPSFLALPELDYGAPTPSQPMDLWYLLAEIKDNMTINKPTLVLFDRENSPFALVFEGLDRDGLDLKGLGFKKGCTAIIPYARRTKPADEGKRPFVRIEKENAASVRAVPGPLARVLELSGKDKGNQCETCGASEGNFKSCTGCQKVGYCSKVSSCSELVDINVANTSHRIVKSQDGMKAATRKIARSSRP